MRVRYRARPDTVGHSSEFNTSSVSEVIVHFPNGEATSESMDELDVLILGAWTPMRDALRDHQIVPDNHHTRFAEPADQAARDRGYNW